MGLTFTEARRLSPAIAEFISELGEYLDMPVRAYSTGMFLRLAFAISTSVFPEIIIMDEMIGAGDAAFIEKAHRVGELVQRAQILVLASHSVSILRRFCNKILCSRRAKCASMERRKRCSRRTSMPKAAHRRRLAGHRFGGPVSSRF